MLNEKRGRKAQVTIFIIVGVLLLLAVMLVLFIKNEVATEQTRRSLPTILSEAPQELKPVQNYVEQCMLELGKEAVERVGRHGGYVGLTPETQEYTRLSGGFTLDVSGQNPTDSDAIQFTPGSSWYVPYWHFLSTKNDGSEGYLFSTRMPLLRKGQAYNSDVNYGGRDSSVEAQIERYIDLNLMECLNNFAPFEKTGVTIRIVSDPKTSVVIAEKDVGIYLDMPLEITKVGEPSKALATFKVDLGVNLYQIFDYASELTSLLVEHKFLDMFGRNMLSTYGGLDNPLPPFHDATFTDSTPKFWITPVVKEHVQSFLTVNLAELQVDGTKNMIDYSQTNDRIKEGIYKQMTLPSPRQSNLAVDFHYNHHPLYFKIGDKAIVQPQQRIPWFIRKMFPILSLLEYNAAYDFSYPAIVEVRDENAFGGEGYSLFFAMEGNIRENGYIIESEIPEGQDFTIEFENPVCNHEQWNTGEIILNVVNNLGEPVPDTELAVLIGQTCYLGRTTMQDGKAMLKTRLPVGIAAMSLFHKEYTSSVIPFATRNGESKEIVLEIQKPVEKKIKLRKYTWRKKPLTDETLHKDNFVAFGAPPAPQSDELHDLERTALEDNWEFDAMQRDLASDERTVVFLQRHPSLDEELYDLEYTKAIMLYGDEVAEETILPGDYTMTVTSIKDASLYFPKCIRCIRGEDLDEFKIEDTHVQGIYEVNITLTEGELYNEFNGLELNIMNVDYNNTPYYKRFFTDLMLFGEIGRTVNEPGIKNVLTQVTPVTIN